MKPLTHPMTAAAAINCQSVKASALRDDAHGKHLLDVLRERAEARVILIANGYLDLQRAVDELWAAAERDGLVDKFGADEIQWLLSDAFGRWRLANE